MGKVNKDLNKVVFLVIGFAGWTTYPLGALNFLVVLGEV